MSGVTSSVAVLKNWLSYDAPWWIRRWKPSEFRFRARMRNRSLTERDVRGILYGFPRDVRVISGLKGMLINDDDRAWSEFWGKAASSIQTRQISAEDLS
jgi:hypothetical protein